MLILPTKNPLHLRVAIFGDIVGISGRETAKEMFHTARQNWNADLIIANGENASHGLGITPNHVQNLHDSGLDLMTLGNHSWDKYALRNKIKNFSFIARPINQPRETPGAGYAIADTKFGPFAVINALGRLFMNPVDCPYHAVYDQVKEFRSKHRIKMIALDIHAEAASEKIIMGLFLDGKVSMVWGSHTHVQTADETILPNGTAYISDIGMNGAYHSVIGFQSSIALKKTIYGDPLRHCPETAGPRISTGIVVDVDPKNGSAVNITRFREILPALDNLIEDSPKQNIEKTANEK